MRTRRPRLAPATRSAFAGFRFPADVIVLAVRWYLRFGLSYRDVEELLAERGVEVDHVTVYRWVQRFTPLLADAARPCRHRVGDRWSVDETYVKVGGRWRYVYRAIDQFGQVIDVYVSPRRDATAAHRFFERVLVMGSGQSAHPPLVRFSDRAQAELRTGEALVFDWTSLAFCRAAAGEISLRPTTLPKVQRSPTYVPLQTRGGPWVFAHRRAYPMLVGRDIEVDCRRRLGVRSFSSSLPPDLGLRTSFGCESGGDHREDSASGAEAPTS